MRRAADGAGRLLLAGGCLAVVAGAAVGTAWGYINGGDFHSTFLTFVSKLEAEGWRVGAGRALPDDARRTGEAAPGVRTEPADNPEFRRHVNELVVAALREISAEQRVKVSAAAKTDVAGAVARTLRTAVATGQSAVEEGTTDGVSYRVGVVSYSSHWVTNYGGRRKTHASRNGLMPFVALKVPGVPSAVPAPVAPAKRSEP